MPSVLALALFASIASAAEPAAEIAIPKPRAFSAHLQQGGQHIADRLGAHGAWVVTSAERWDQVKASLAALNVPAEDHLKAVDFAKENLACVFHYGDEGDQFVAKSVSVAGEGDKAVADVQVGMSYIVYKQRRALSVGVWRLYAIPVPKAPVTKISVHTFHPMNGGPYPTLDKAQLAWAWTCSAHAGEAIAFLTGTIAPQAKTVAPGADILVKFTLAFADGRAGPADQFTRSDAKAVHVWDGKYSNGYRNHAFEVVTPDGKVHHLRPKALGAWDKNAPHPVAISADKPYVLPNWMQGDVLKSLKALGLDTTQPGAYAITGIYEQVGRPANQQDAEMWLGVLRTNTVVVNVGN
ncbi:MAG TPA: hypothetical protein VEA69_01655 [Tepidisphaeraceae bacterium]|nr:hypothetical protein [Tepidisphaeraceae bacterium]